MNPNENTQQHSKEYKSIVQDWPVGRIKALSEAPGMGLKGLANYLGITPRTLRLLISGEYTPSATFCRRLEMIEREVLDGKDSYKDILPRRAEMRRRLLLFRSWWMNRPASLALPEVTVSIKVRWGKGVINAFEIPARMMPKMRVSSFSGLLLVIREVIKTLRKVTRSYAKLAWSSADEDFWAAYASNDIPAEVEKRLKQPAMARAARTEKERLNASNA